MAYSSLLRSAASVAAVAIALSACSIGGLMTTFSVDTSAKSQPPATRTALAGNPSTSSAGAGAAASAASAPVHATALAEQKSDPVLAGADAQSGTSIDEWLKAESAAHPMVTASSSLSTGADSFGGPGLSSGTVPGVDPITTASLMPQIDPTGAGSGLEKQSRISGLLPLPERQCRSQLQQMGVQFEEVSAIANGSHCGIEHPLKVEGLAGGVGVSPGVVLNCDTTLALAQWVQNEVNPAVRVRYLSSVETVQTMGGYSCRRMNNGRKNTSWSEHSTGNAVDIGGFKLKNGREIEVSSKGFFAFRERGFMKSIRASSCGYFNTVLGPGYPKHDDHLHLDLMERSSDKTYCS